MTAKSEVRERETSQRGRTSKVSWHITVAPCSYWARRNLFENQFIQEKVIPHNHVLCPIQAVGARKLMQNRLW